MKEDYHHHDIAPIENWKIGKIKGAVITDSNEGFKESTGHAEEEAKEYYGGNLVCESIWREKDVFVIASAYKMLDALQNLENDDNQIPPHAWKKVQDAIASAQGNTKQTR